MSKILEMSADVVHGGRKGIRMVLLTVHKDGEMNKNGITWTEENILNNLDSIKNIPICATFMDEEKTLLFDHGYTETVELGDGKSEPLFNNSEVVGTIEKAQIEDLDIDGTRRRVLVGYGFLYCQRYHALCEKLAREIVTSSVKSSIEIVGKKENDSRIVYDGGYKDKGRKPASYDFSATCLLGVEEADDSCYVLQIAQKQNKEENTMDEKTIRDVVVSTITETNSKNEELTNKIQELNDAIKERDDKIAELTKNANDKKDADKEKDDKIQELNNKLAEAESKLNECKKAEQNSRLDKALESFSEEEQKFAESEINSFKEDPLNGDVDAIIEKIYSKIGQASKEANKRDSEQNSANNKDEFDIFSEVNSAEDVDDDTNIF